jgi:hypothetical protein
MMSEQAAGERWCPWSRAPAYSSFIAVNRDPGAGVKAQCLCLASGCMAWRWHDPKLDDTQLRRQPNGQRRGYCGIAGKPETEASL